MTNTLYLIRHGDTEGTENKLFYGSTDLPLSENGFRQVAKLREAGAYPSPEGASLFTSGMTRTEQTFHTIYGDLEHGMLPELQEINVGIYEMKSFAEIMEDEEAAEWSRSGNKYMDFPEGDSEESFKNRVGSGLAFLRRESQFQNVIAVLHGAVITTALSMMFPDIVDNLWEYTPDPGNGYAIVLEDGEPKSFARIHE